MRFAYNLEPGDRDGQGNWLPTLCWEDGMVTESQGRIEGSESFETARSRIGRWNWNHGISAQDADEIIHSCYQSIATQPGKAELWNT